MCTPPFPATVYPPPYPYEGFFAHLACLQGDEGTNEARIKHCMPQTITKA